MKCICSFRKWEQITETACQIKWLPVNRHKVEHRPCKVDDAVGAEALLIPVRLPERLQGSPADDDALSKYS